MSDSDPDPKDELGARFDEHSPGGDDGENTDTTTEIEPTEDVEDTSGESERESEAVDEWVRVQFRVPETLRTDLNEIGYAKLTMELRERDIEGKEKRELQRAAVQVLLDNPGLWADTVEELDEP